MKTKTVSLQTKIHKIIKRNYSSLTCKMNWSLYRKCGCCCGNTVVLWFHNSYCLIEDGWACTPVSAILTRTLQQPTDLVFTGFRSNHIDILWRLQYYTVFVIPAEFGEVVADSLNSMNQIVTVLRTGNRIGVQCSINFADGMWIRQSRAI